MKIFSAQQIRQADETTILSQNITSTELMERAAGKAFEWIRTRFPDKATPFYIYCGQGNNGGDGLAIARMLLHEGYGNIKVEIVENTGSPTKDFSINKQRMEQAGISFEKINGNSVGGLVIIDALFGIGLNRELSDEVRQAIRTINAKEATVISIDVPSGMFMDRKTDLAVKADVVLTFQSPKLPFFFAGNKDFVNDFEVLDIGLDNEFITATKVNHHYIDADIILNYYKPVAKHAHKGTQGHAVIIGGSYGKIGAVCLSAKAALKSGCGLITAYIPQCGYDILQSSFPEAMVLTSGLEHIDTIHFEFEPRAIGLGPGLGQHAYTQKEIGDFLSKNKIPLVIDADALNILSQNKEWLKLPPENTILTPHPKELERLMGSWNDDFDKLEKMKAFSRENDIILVSKDACTMIVHNDKVYVNSTGNAGLATGGSGDVLTGIITGLLAQGYKPIDAAIFGVYLHGLSADIGVKETSRQAFIASDILKYMGRAYLEIDGGR
ncbi:NAD(P)H-hydrate dehydratase [Flavobacterium suzhouense]|uniref:Bifunctional NAD(P)H-hydrate repair enzyme n=1 Tax=Flavobacterium suzhouense TaxID=1529638 RepID=A0ABW5NZZ2_9FLAO